MSDAKPYTPEDWAEVDDIDPSMVAATVEELERLRVAADAMEAELEAARTYLRERCFLDPPCDLCRCKAQVLKRMNALRRPR